MLMSHVEGVKHNCNTNSCLQTYSAASFQFSAVNKSVASPVRMLYSSMCMQMFHFSTAPFDVN